MIYRKTYLSLALLLLLPWTLRAGDTNPLESGDGGIIGPDKSGGSSPSGLSDDASVDELVWAGHSAVHAFSISEALEIAKRIPESERDLPKVRYFLGRLAFLQGKYSDALDLFGDTTYVGRDGETDDFPAYVARVAEAVSGLSVVESEHFHILYDATGPDQVLIPYALDTLEKAYRVLSAELDHVPKEKVRIEIFPEGSRFIQASGLKGSEIETTGTIALCIYDKVMITSPRALALGFRWMDTLSHELVHLLVAQKSRNQVPVWLQEGIAKFFEVRWRGGRGADMTRASESLLAEALEADKLVPFERMSPSLAKLPSAAEAQLAFAQVQTVIEYIINERGVAGIHRLMTDMGGGMSDRQAIEDVLGVPFAQFESTWKEFMRSKRLRKLEGLALLPTILKAQGIESDSAAHSDDPFMAEHKELREFTRLGDLLRERGRFKAALIEYQKAEESSPVMSPALSVKIALTHLEGNNLRQARKVLEKTVERYPSFAPAFSVLGRTLLKSGELEASLAAYKEANAINPFDPFIHRAMAALYRDSGMKEKAALEQDISVTLHGFMVEG